MNRRAFLIALAVLPSTAPAFVYYKKEHHRKVDIYTSIDGQQHHKQFFANRSLEEELYNMKHRLEEYIKLKQGDFVRMETSTEISVYVVSEASCGKAYTIKKK